MTYLWLDSDTAFAEYQNSLSDRGIFQIAVDIENESNLHEYGEKLCLLQLFDGERAALVDPFRVSQRALKQFLENRSLLKIAFDAPSDRAFLYKNCRIDMLSILDLQAAVILLDYPRRDLASVLNQSLGLESGPSKKRFQKHNWTRRPVDPDAIEYALGDVIHLFALKEKLFSEIQQAGMLDKFLLENIQRQNKPHEYDRVPGFLRSKKVKSLSARQQKLCADLYRLRDRHARELNWPPHRVMENDVLLLTASGKLVPDHTHAHVRLSPERRTTLIAEIRGVCKSLSV